MAYWLVGVAVLGASTGSAWAGKGNKREREVTLAEVPKAVKATILKEAGKNAIEEIEEITRGKRKVYEAEWTVGGREVEIKVAADGRLLSKKQEREREVSLDQVPAAVRKTVIREAGGNSIDEIEVNTRGKRTFYEAEWHAGGKEIEIKVAPNGKVLSREVEDDDDDDD